MPALAPAIVPSYVAKLSRAEKHLIELEEAIDEYAASRPYAVRKGIEGKKKKVVHRLVFRKLAENTDIPIIAADVVYNLRSGLDHLMSALVANKERSSVIFPVMFQGVWEPGVPGEDAQRAKLRARWASDTKSLKAGTLTVIKALQPPDDAGDGTLADRMYLLNTLSNRDRHEKLPVIATGLDKPKLFVKAPDGRELEGFPLPDRASDFAHDNARLNVPEDSVEVKIEGTPLVVVRVGQKDTEGRERYVRLPDFLREAIPFLRNRAINPLISHVRR
jgi:hypothetical protein